MKKGFVALVVVLVCSAFVFPDEIGIPKVVSKKVDKTIEALWPDSNVEIESVSINATTKAKLPNQLSYDKYFKLYSKNVLVGYLFLEKADGKFSYFDYMVIFKPDFSILSTQVLMYRESHGGEISNKKWLSQFESKKAGNAMEFGKDINNISGATISCRNISLGIKNLSENLNQMRVLKAI